ncbi:MAG: hypothetical protein K6B14_09730 [Lachnospiraceae bacterium]|nr:hypothetical protein [Lachnospiraceae bacterium]
MMSKEKTNIIIKLAEMGFTHKQIDELLVFIETHSPSEEEEKAAVEKASNN